VPDPQPQTAPASPPIADSTAQAREEYERRAAAAELARIQAEGERARAERQAPAGTAMEPARRERMQESRRLRSAVSPGEESARHQSPEQWLQGIADLRRQGRDEEADKALAEFRRAYPDYRIPDAMREKVEKAR
jgi:hypothetical protein